jgi:hypothetical protein
MSNELKPAEIRLRRPVVVAALGVVTLGIYTIVWYYKINREMRDFGASRGDTKLGDSRPWRSAIAIALRGIPALVSFVRITRRVQAANGTQSA